jgi:hypothetical protein
MTLDRREGLVLTHAHDSFWAAWINLRIGKNLRSSTVVARLPGQCGTAIIEDFNASVFKYHVV